MEGLGGLHRAGAVVCVLLLVVASLSSSPAAARPGVGFREAVREVDPAPFHMAATTGDMGRGNAGVSEGKVKVTKIYAPLLLNLLPRGSLPPSGPGGGIDDIKA